MYVYGVHVHVCMCVFLVGIRERGRVWAQEGGFSSAIVGFLYIGIASSLQVITCNFSMGIIDSTSVPMLSIAQ